MASREVLELCRRGYAALAASLAPAPSRLVAGFRHWHYPAAGPQVSWAVFIAPGRLAFDPPVIRRGAWDRDVDLERIELATRVKPGLGPTITWVEQAVPAEGLHGFMSRGSRLAVQDDWLVPPYMAECPPELGLEGMNVRPGDAWPRVRLEWSALRPEALRAVDAWARDLRAWLRTVLE